MRKSNPVGHGNHLNEVALRTVPDAHWRMGPVQDGVRLDSFQKSVFALGEADLVGVGLAWAMVLRGRRRRTEEPWPPP